MVATVSYFENLNLREANAQLQIVNRELEAKRVAIEAENRRVVAERERLEAEAKAVFKSASNAEARTKRLEMFAVCTQVEEAVNTILRNVRDKRIAIRLLMLTRDQIVGEYPKHAITELTTVRSLLDVAMKHEMMSVIGDGGTKAELIARWEKIATNYGMLLDLVLLPNSTPWGPTTKAYLDRTEDNFKVGIELKNDLVDSLWT